MKLDTFQKDMVVTTICILAFVGAMVALACAIPPIPH